MPGNAKDRDNGKTLEEIKIGNGDIIKVLRRIEESPTFPKADLVTLERKLTPRATAAFTEIFGRFAKQGAQKLFLPDLAAFTRACLGSNANSDNDDKVKRVMKDYDKGNKGYLVVDDFLKFFENASISRESAVRDNLKTMGYCPDLTRFALTSEYVSASAAKAQSLPRYILSNNPEFRDLLFALLSNISLNLTHARTRQRRIGRYIPSSIQPCALR